jgi:hypothetical protein
LDQITNWPKPPNRLPVPAGHALVMIEHTHSFSFSICQPTCPSDAYARGPSKRDYEIAREYPEAFHVIHGAGLSTMLGVQSPPEYIYYGHKAGLP